MSSAITSLALTQSSIAMVKVRKSECKVLISDFNDINHPEVSEMQEYAECVRLIHPNSAQESQEKELLQFSLVFTVVAFSICMGIIFYSSKRLGNYFDAKESAIKSAFITFFAWIFLFILGLFYYAFS